MNVALSNSITDHQIITYWACHDSTVACHSQDNGIALCSALCRPITRILPYFEIATTRSFFSRTVGTNILINCGYENTFLTHTIFSFRLKNWYRSKNRNQIHVMNMLGSNKVDDKLCKTNHFDLHDVIKDVTARLLILPYELMFQERVAPEQAPYQNLGDDCEYRKNFRCHTWLQQIKKISVNKTYKDRRS